MFSSQERHINLGRRDVVGILASLLLAFALWLIHNLSLNYSGTLSVPVIAESNIPGHFNVCESPVVISARCRTSGYTMLFRGRKPVRIFIAPEDFKFEEGDYFSITDNELSRYVAKIFGTEVSLESFSSPSYLFRFPFENNRKVSVTPVLSITYDDEYASVGDPVLVPDSVIVYGEPNLVDALETVFTEPLSLSGVSTSKHGTLRLAAPKGIRLSSDQTHYSLRVTRCVEMKRTVKVEVSGVPSDKELMVFPSEAEVTYRCTFPVGGDVSSAIRLFVDYEDFQNSLNGRCVARTGDLPESILSLDVEPQVFECFETSAE